MIKAIVFDFYGVIYSNFNWDVIDRRIYGNEVNAREFRELIKSANIGEMTNEEMMSRVALLADDEHHPSDRAASLNPSINLVAIGLIDTLKSNYKIGLLSNGSREHLTRVFSDLGGLDKYFDVVATSSDIKQIKPNLEAYEYIVSKLGCSPGEVLMIDDSFRHVEGAQKAGLEAFLFKDINSLRAKLDSLGNIYA